MAKDVAETYMLGVLLVALADGVIDREEKRLIRKLQKKLDIDNEQLGQLVDRFKAGEEVGFQVPASERDREAALDVMVIAAHVDGDVSSEEQLLLERVAKRFGVTGDRWRELYRKAVGRAKRLRPGPTDTPKVIEASPPEPDVPPEVRNEISSLIDSFYAHFHEWPDARERAGRFVEIGRPCVLPLVRAYESYRSAAGGADTLALKVLFAEVLGELGDTRALYYLTSQLQLDDESEITNAALRAASAEAVGKITGRGFSRDAAGVADAKRWWLGEGMLQYRELAF